MAEYVDIDKIEYRQGVLCYKIDKAIAELEEYIVEYNCEDGVIFALETLKRCLKEIRR